MSLLIYIRHSAEGDLHVTVFRDKTYHKKMLLSKYLTEQKPKDIVVIKFSGEVNFINVANELELINRLEGQESVVLSLSQIEYMDIDGLESFEEIIESFEKSEIPFYISGVDGRLADLMKKLPLYQHVVSQKKIKESSSVALHDLHCDRHNVH